MLTDLASAALLAGLSAGAYAFAGNWPTSQIFGRTILAGGDAREIALTYDDGPNDPCTPQLLEILARHEVRATFFLIGQFARRRPHLARSIRESGHLIGSHTMTHPALLWQRPARVREEIAGGNAAVEDATGCRVAFFRPPYGVRRPDVLRIAGELGLATVMWNAMGRDWDAPAPERIAGRVERAVERNRRRRRGSNILLHDGGHARLGADRGPTLAATGALLQAWAGTGVRLVTVDCWADCRAAAR